MSNLPKLINHLFGKTQKKFKIFIKYFDTLLPYSEKCPFLAWVSKNKFIIFLLLLVFILRIPSLFEPYWYGDEGIYVSIGLAIKKGLLLYRDAFDNKPPMIYLLAAAAGGTIFWFRFFLMGSVLLSIFFFYRLAQLLFENKDKSSKISVLIFSLFTTIRIFEGNVANSEMFILLPTTLGFFLIFKYFDKPKEKLNFIVPLFSGIILSIGFLFKVPAVFDFVSIMIFLVLLNNQKKPVNIGKKEILLVTGYFIPILLISLFFYLKGAFSVYFNSVFVQMFGYLSSWKTGTHAFSLINLLKSELVLKGILVLVISSLLWIRRKNISKMVLFTGIWFTFSLFGATLSGRPYSHYLIQIVPPLSFLIGSLLSQKAKKEILIPIFLVILFCVTFFYYHFWTYTTVTYYQNFIDTVFKQKSKTEYLSFFNWNLPQLYNLGEKIKAYSNPNDRIFIWSDEPSLYAMSKRLPATPYLASYHIIDLNMYDKTYADLLSNRPTLIVIDSTRKFFSRLDALVKTSYVRVESVGSFSIYSKRAI